MHSHCTVAVAPYFPLWARVWFAWVPLCSNDSIILAGDTLSAGDRRWICKRVFVGQPAL